MLAPSGSTVLTILLFYKFYHSVALVSAAIFQLRQFSALPVYTFYHFARAPTSFSVLPLLPILQYWGPINYSHPSQSFQPSSVGNTYQGTQTGRSRNPSRYSYNSHTSLPRPSYLPKPPCRYSYAAQSNKSNIPMVSVRGGPKLSVTPNLPKPNSRVAILVILV